MSSPQEWTVARLIKWASGYLGQKGCASPRLDTELLLAQSLGVRRLDLYLEYQKPLTPRELSGFKELLLRRSAGEPVAYITGTKGFHKIELKVCPATLIPRPETETLVEAALERLPQDSDHKVLEMGAGAGGVIISLALERPGIVPTATDISGQALDQARQNADQAGLSGRIEFAEGDLFAPLQGRAFDLILMNPPYVSQAEYKDLARDIVEFEPRNALVAGDDGLEVIRRLVEQAPAHLQENGWLLFEMGAGQGRAAAELLNAGPYEQVEILPDLAGLDRVAVGRKRRG